MTVGMGAELLNRRDLKIEIPKGKFKMKGSRNLMGKGERKKENNQTKSNQRNKQKTKLLARMDNGDMGCGNSLLMWGGSSFKIAHLCHGQGENELGDEKRCWLPHPRCFVVKAGFRDKRTIRALNHMGSHFPSLPTDTYRYFSMAFAFSAFY